MAIAGIVLLAALISRGDVASWAGDYVGNGITVSLNLGNGTYTGVVVKGTDSYPLTAELSPDSPTLNGEFTVGAQSYGFSATLNGDVLTFNTGGASYALTRSANAANPVPAPASGNPLAGAPAPSDAGAPPAAPAPADAGAPPAPPAPADASAPPAGQITGGQLPGASAAVAEGTIPLGDDSTPAPSWLVPGARISLLMASAGIAGSENELTPCNSNDDGAFYDDKTGQWYHEVPVPGVGAMGVQEETVLAIDGHRAILSQRGELMLGQGQWGFSGAGWGSADVASGGDLWQSPDLIRRASLVQGPPMWVMRMPYTLEGGKQFTVLRIQSPHLSMNFDVDTGLLIRESSQSQQPDLKYHYDNEDPRKGSAILAQVTFLNERTMPYPWIGKPAPDWIKTVQSVRVQQQQSTFMQGVPPYNMPPQLVDINIKSRGADWVAGTLDAEPAPQAAAPMMPAPGMPFAAGSAGGPGSLFLPPAGLAGLTVGQVIDTDPVTKMTTTVTSVGPNQDGRQVIEFTEDLPGLRFQSQYDLQTGMVLKCVRSQQLGPAVTTETDTVVGVQ
jgi:hypothetical protein